MKTVLKKNIKNAVGIGEIRDAELKRVAMLLMENIRSIHSQVEEVQKAIKELQGRR